MADLGLTAAMPVLLLLTSLVPAAIIFLLPEDREGVRRTVNMAGAVLKVVLTAVLIAGVLDGVEYEFRRRTDTLTCPDCRHEHPRRSLRPGLHRASVDAGLRRRREVAR